MVVQTGARNHKKQQGFTLIELLVVIAIIAILAAILFPVFARARENARRSSCQSNLKQMALGVFQYTQDYDEKFPLVYQMKVAPYHEGWAQVVQPYMKSVQIFQCPSESHAPNLVPDAGGGRDTGFCDYFYNANLGPYSSDGNVSVGYAVNIASVPNSTVVVMNGDGGWGRDYQFANCHSSTGCGAPNQNGNGDVPPSWYTADGAGGSIDTVVKWNAAGVMKRHLEGANYSFVDGHVKWLKQDALTYEDPATTGKATFRVS